MYPHELIKGTGIDLYIVLILLGIVAALFAARLLSRAFDISAKLFNFVIIVGVGAIIVGWLSAMLFQSLFNYLATGEFKASGQTFYGGLVGGAAAFLAIYFIAGRFVFKDKEHVRALNEVISLAFPCVALAHAIGRLGCLTAGCCYGKVTESWLGITTFSGGIWAKRVPVQLFEAIFLFALFSALVFLVLKFRLRAVATVYLVGYGVWRFFIEYLRADGERGSSGISFLTPSQLFALILIALGAAWYFVYKYLLKERIENVGNK